MSTNFNENNAYGVGFLGEGIYKASFKRIYYPQYTHWRSMLKRCYSEEFQSINTSYRGCTVDERWYNYQNFAQWYIDNYYEIEGERMHLDKDILIKGNRIYSPDNCVFVPQSINSLFVKSDAARGNFPIGVRFYKDGRKLPYGAVCSIGKRKQEYLGSFSSPLEAFQTYKIFKEKIIKQVAEEYRMRIPENLYLAMVNYEVEIND